MFFGVDACKENRFSIKTGNFKPIRSELCYKWCIDAFINTVPRLRLYQQNFFPLNVNKGGVYFISQRQDCSDYFCAVVPMTKLAVFGIATCYISCFFI